MRSAPAILAVVVMAPGLSTGCVAGLDSFVFNGRQCGNNGKATCEDQAPERRSCTPCDEPYPFAQFGIPKESAVQVTVDTGDGETVDAWHITGSGERTGTTIVYAHGNFAGIEHYLNRVGFLYRTGADLFVIDYRGYGKSSTAENPTEEQLYDDARAARKAMEARLAPGERVIFYGYSMGALSTVQLAVDEAPCGMVLEAPWPSAQSFADDSTVIGLPRSFITTGAYDNIGKMHDVRTPLLLIHGTADDFVRIELSDQLFAEANEPKRFERVRGADHGNNGPDIPTVMGVDAYVQVVADFIDPLVCE